MPLKNEKVQHTNFGVGVITEEKDYIIWVQFQENIGVKAFVYPDAFEKFLKATNEAVQSTVMEDLHKKLEQLEVKRKEKEREAIELEERLKKIEPVKRKKSVTVTKRKSI